MIEKQNNISINFFKIISIAASFIISFLIAVNITSIISSSNIFTEKLNYEEIKQETKNQKLIVAIISNDIREVERLIKIGADINIKDKNGWTPLIWAVGNDHLEIAQLLISSGANVNETDNEGKTALFWALSNSRIVLLLLSSGANVNIQAHNGFTPLMQAQSVFFRSSSAPLLIRFGATK